MSHFIQKCRKCGETMSQCRCADPSKTVIYGICSTCTAEEEQTHDETETAPPSHWLEYCSWCKRKHMMHIGPCASCGGAYGVGQPVSERVAEQCGRTYRCDGCGEYEKHLWG